MHHGQGNKTHGEGNRGRRPSQSKPQNHHILPLQDSLVQGFLSPVCSQSKLQPSSHSFRADIGKSQCLLFDACGGTWLGAARICTAWSQRSPGKPLGPAQRGIPATRQSCREGLKVPSALQADPEVILGCKCHPSRARAGGSFTLPILTRWSCCNPQGHSEDKENLTFLL